MMKNILYILVYHLIVIIPVFSSAQDTTFIKSYGQIGYNYGEKIIQTADSGYLILGNKSGFTGNTDVWLIRTNYYGKYIWDKAYGGSEVDWAEDIVPTKDHGYIITGYMSIPEKNNDYNVMLLKTDSIGNMQWIKNYGGSNWDFGHSVVETSDSGFIIAGETYSYGNGNNDVFILRTDKNGDSLWAKWYGGPKNDIAYDISSCHDGNFIVTGITNSFGKGNYDIYLLKLSAFGDTLWTRTYGDTGEDKAFAGIETKDHGFALTGSTTDFGARAQDGFILKTDSAGNMLWLQVDGGSGDEEFYDIIQRNDESFFMVGYTTSFGYIGSKDFYMVKTDQYGWFIFGQTYGGSNDDVANSGVATFDNGYAVVGTTESMGQGISNILFDKIDSVGNQNYSSYYNITDVAEYSKEAISIYPNPVADKLYILIPSQNTLTIITIFNQQGQVVYKNILKNKYSATVDFSNFSEGVYILEINNGENIIRKKIIHIE